MNKYFNVSVASLLVVALGSIGTAQSQQRNLSAETAGPTGVPGKNASDRVRVYWRSILRSTLPNMNKCDKEGILHEPIR
jgi:hypothetical protein